MTSTDKFTFYLFADDTNMYADKDLKLLETTANAELAKVYTWLTANKLRQEIKFCYFSSTPEINQLSN